MSERTAKGQSQSGNRQQATGNYTHLLTNCVNYPIAYIPNKQIIFTKEEFSVWKQKKLKNIRGIVSVIEIAIITTGIFTSCNLAANVKNYNIYFFGNSITITSPDAEVGWYGNWGMAATAEENDYVHKLIVKIENEQNISVKINYGLRNISDWECNFEAINTLESIEKTDLLIIRLGENVNEEYAKNNNYYGALEELIQRFKGDNTKIIITDNYWPSEYKDNIQKIVAVNNGYYFVQINNLFSNPENSAFGQFEHLGVAAHPSDIGMENIAQRIFECIKNNRIIN